MVNSFDGSYFLYGNPIYRSTWVSTSASFDEAKHTLNYTYSNDKIIDQNTGFANYQFIKQGKKRQTYFLVMLQVIL